LRLSVVIPILNEEEVLPALHERLAAVLDELGQEAEVIFVDDGSTDRSWEIVGEIHERDARFGGLSLSRNFGHQAAITAGLEAATGDVVALMDGDLQDPPEFLPELLAKLEQGYDVVQAVKAKRREPFWRRWAFGLFYAVQTRLSNVPMQPGAGTFSVMTRRVADVVRRMQESNRYVSGLRAYAGFKQTGIEFDRPERFAGVPRQTFGKLLKLALDGIFSFSHLPAKIATWLGFLFALLAMGVTIQVLVKKWITHEAILGWASTMTAILVLGAVQLICIGILGEYIARIYDEVRRRPPYVVRERIGGRPAAEE